MLLLVATAWGGFEDLVADPVDTLLADRNTPRGFRIIALSNAAEACVNLHLAGERDLEQARGCTDRLARAALDPRLLPWDSGEIGENNLYATHLAIVLAARDRLDPGGCDVALHARLAEHLAERSLAHPDGIARTFPSSFALTPTDQTAVLYALHRYDQAHGGTLTAEPLARYLAWVERARRDDGLLPSEVTHTTATADQPRGSSMTWAVRYLATVAPEAAARMWTATRETLVVHVGPVTGVREWAPGVDFPADIDSGPIVAGIGAAATSFGIGASRAVGDTATFQSLRRTEQLGRVMAAGDTALAEARDSALADAIATNQRSLVPWE